MPRLADGEREEGGRMSHAKSAKAAKGAGGERGNLQGCLE